MGTPFPGNPSALTHILVVADVDRARTFWTEVVGATLHREYGGTSAVLRFLDAWLLLVTGGPPTADKPGTTFAPPADPRTVSHAMTIRVDDCRAAYDALRERGAVFLTPPVESEYEVRAFFCDPDGHLLEISEARR